MRFRSDPVPRYGEAFLLWPRGNDWNRGEIDYPEGALNRTFGAYSHRVGNPRKNCFGRNTGTSYAKWHTATIEWVPGRVSFFLDGRQVGTTTRSTPSSPMRWTFQWGTVGGVPVPSAQGHFYIDWAVMYARA